MKPAVLISIFQTFVLVVVAYKWIDLEQQKLAYSDMGNFSEEIQENSEPRRKIAITHPSNTPPNALKPVTSDEVRAIIRDELKAYSIPWERSIASSEKGSDNQKIEHVLVDNQYKFEQLDTKLQEFELNGAMRQSDMENLFIGLGGLSKEQRKKIRSRLTKAINSRQINLIN